MKVIDSDGNNFTTIELETESGICNFRATMKADNKGDLRALSRDVETLELGNYIQNNVKASQIYVKVGDTYTNLKR